MKYAIYEDPLTHTFALLRLPSGFVDGDKVPILSTDRWFENYAKALAALPELLNREESELDVGLEDTHKIDDVRDSR